MVDQSAFCWPEGVQGVVSISYDDALPCHYEDVAPAWEAHGLRVTFYTNIISLMNNPGAWRDVGAKGHELGNHSIFHPCRKNQGHDWLADEYDLRRYTPRRWTDEMRTANAILSSLDGKEERSFGNTCCNTDLGEGDTLHSLEPLIEELFVAGRGPFNNRVVDAGTLNFNSLGHFSGDGCDFDHLRLEIADSVDHLHDPRSRRRHSRLVHRSRGAPESGRLPRGAAGFHLDGTGGNGSAVPARQYRNRPDQTPVIEGGDSWHAA